MQSFVDLLSACCYHTNRALLAQVLDVNGVCLLQDRTSAPQTDMVEEVQKAGRNSTDANSIAVRSGKGSALSRATSCTCTLVCVHTDRLETRPCVSSLQLYAAEGQD